MRALDIKLWRELWHLRGQAAAIALVIVGGVAVCIMSLSTLDTLVQTRDSYYRDYRLGDLFVSLKRAPNHLQQQIEQLPGVAEVETRVVAAVSLQLTGSDEPATGLLTSIPDHSDARLNRLYIRSGRLADGRRDNELVVSDAFAEANKLQINDTVVAVINGKHKRLTIVGIALSPEYIYEIAPGAIVPDYKRYGVMWMARTPLSTAYDMEGAFNDLVLKLQPGASGDDMIDRLDALLKRYGGRGAYDRDDQLSNRFLHEEFVQLRNMAVMFPVIFLSVAAFLLNVVVSRLISTERQQIAVLKAFGYRNAAVGWHYAQLVLLITGFGILGGYALGIWLARGLSELYMDYYRFPFLLYQFSPLVFIAVAAITVSVAMLATLRAVRAAASLPPAQAMREQSPENFRLFWLERAGLLRILSPSGRMILRHMARRPLKTLSSICGLACACGIMMVGNFQMDAIDTMVYMQFSVAQRDDVKVSFTEPVSSAALYSLKSLPGVAYVEGVREVPVQLRYQHRSYRTSLQGIARDAQLQKVLDADLQPVGLPESGLLLPERLASILGAKPGDMLTVEVLEGDRQSYQVPLKAMTKQFLGVSAYMDLQALNRLMNEGESLSSALIKLGPFESMDSSQGFDAQQASTVYRRLREMPAVAGISVRQSLIDSFYETLAKSMLTFTFINTLLGGVIAFGVVYNTVRIMLSERGRELASLRVLGYSHNEVAYILLGELALLTLLAIPLGFLLGAYLSRLMVDQMQTDLYRVPLVLEPDTFAMSALVVLVAALISGLMMWHRLGKLDLVEVLKTRE